MIDWRDRIRKGDILRTRGGTERVVRETTYSRKQPGRLRSVTFVILHCSWTTRCYTTVARTDLASLGYRPVRGTRYRFRLPIDKRVARCLLPQNNAICRQCLDCCDVKGVR